MNFSDNHNYYEKILNNLPEIQKIDNQSLDEKTVDFNGKTYKLIKKNESDQVIPNRLIALALRNHKKDLKAITYSNNTENKNGYELLKSFYTLKEPSWIKRMGAKIAVAFGLRKYQGIEEKYLQKLIPPLTIDKEYFSPEEFTKKVSNINLDLIDDNSAESVRTINVRLMYENRIDVNQIRIDADYYVGRTFQELKNAIVDNNPELNVFDFTFIYEGNPMADNTLISNDNLLDQSLNTIFIKFNLKKGIKEESFEPVERELHNPENINNIYDSLDLNLADDPKQCTHFFITTINRRTLPCVMDSHKQSLADVMDKIKAKNPQMNDFKMTFVFVDGKAYTEDTVEAKNISIEDIKREGQIKMLLQPIQSTSNQSLNKKGSLPIRIESNEPKKVEDEPKQVKIRKTELAISVLGKVSTNIASNRSGVVQSIPTTILLKNQGNSDQNQIVNLNLKFNLQELEGKTFKDLDQLLKQKNPNLKNYKISYAIGKRQYKPDAVISVKNLLKPGLANFKITLIK